MRKPVRRDDDRIRNRVRRRHDDDEDPEKRSARRQAWTLVVTLTLAALVFGAGCGGLLWYARQPLTK